jgi:hypothetical protein
MLVVSLALKPNAHNGTQSDIMNHGLTIQQLEYEAIVKSHS